MKIISLQAENVKKLVAVEITPNGNLVEITGKNGQGKTSVLDSIWWALTGTTHIQAAPIRKGANEARIHLDLGDLKVIRKFARKSAGEGYTTSIVVENAEGARFPSAQKVLDSLLGELSFDPLEFSRMKPRDQFDALRRFVPGVDFEAIDNLNRGDFERRTELNRFAKQERAAASTITVPADTPEEPIDEAELVTQLEAAGEANAQTERRRANREKAHEKVAALRVRAGAIDQLIASAHEGICAARDRIIEDNGREIRDLRLQIRQLEERITQADGRIDTARNAAISEMDSQAETLRTGAAGMSKEADELDAQIKAAGPLPEITDTAELTKGIALASATNTNVRKLDTRMAHHRRAADLEAQADALTAAMEKRKAEKLAAIAAAKMPVPGIEFGDGLVLLNGVPFDQASDAEQLSASVRIAMALNPKLRVIRIRDGSLLDENAMKLLAEMADANDMQVWIERVDSSGKVGFILEDGHVRQAVVAEPQAATA